jgi:xanthosine utilization system XapX-like protein
MHVLAMLAVLGLSGWLIVSTYRRLARGQFDRAWQIFSLLLTFAGLAVGVCLLNVRSVASPTSRVYGVPFCIAGADFVDGRWLMGVGRFMPLALLTDVSLCVAVCLSPVAAGFVLRERRAARHQEGGGT